MEFDAEASLYASASAKSKNFTIFGPAMTLNVDQIWPKSNEFMYDPRRFSGKIVVDILQSTLLLLRQQET